MFRINRFFKELEAIKTMRKMQGGLTLEKQAQIKKNILNIINHPEYAETKVGFWVKYKHKVLQYASAVLAGLTVFGGTAFASGNALPGQPLYAIKRATEKLQLNIAFSEERKVDLQAKFAEKRIEELDQLQKKHELPVKPLNIGTTSTSVTSTASTTNQIKNIQINKIEKAKNKKTEVEIKAQKEAETEVREALKNLKIIHDKVKESGDSVRAEKLQLNISNLRNRALLRHVYNEDDSTSTPKNIELRKDG